MNKLSKRLGAVALAAAMVVSFWPAAGLVADAAIIKGKAVVTVSDVNTATDPVTNDALVPPEAVKNIGATLLVGKDKKLYASYTARNKKTAYIIVSEGNTDLQDADGDVYGDDIEVVIDGGNYTLDLQGNQFDGDILVTGGGSLVIKDSKTYVKKNSKGTDDADQKFTSESTLTGATNALSTGTLQTDAKNAVNGKDKGYKYSVGYFNGTITVGQDDKSGKLTLDSSLIGSDVVANSATIKEVVVANGTFTQNGGNIGSLDVTADKSVEALKKTSANVTINATSGNENKGDKFINTFAVGKGAKIKIAGGRFNGQNPAKLPAYDGSDYNAIGSTPMVGGATEHPGTPQFFVGSSVADANDGGAENAPNIIYALNGAVSISKIGNFTEAFIANGADLGGADRRFDEGAGANDIKDVEANGGTTLSVTGGNRNSFAVVTTNIDYNYIDSKGATKPGKCTDTIVFSDGGYTYSDDTKTWTDNDGNVADKLNNLNAVTSNTVVGAAGTVLDDYKYTRAIALNIYSSDSIIQTTGIEELATKDSYSVSRSNTGVYTQDGKTGVTYFTADPSKYVSDSFGVAVLDGTKYIVSSDTADGTIDNDSELNNVAGSAEKSIQVLKADGYTKDDNKEDNTSAAVAFKCRENLVITGPKDTVVAVVDFKTTGRYDDDLPTRAFVYGLDNGLEDAAGFGVDVEPTADQKVVFTMNQIPAKAIVPVNGINSLVDVESAEGIDWYGVIDEADTTKGDYLFGASEAINADLAKAVSPKATATITGKKTVRVSDGIKGAYEKVDGDVNITADDTGRFVKTDNGDGTNNWNITSNITVYRLYRTGEFNGAAVGEHFYTASQSEKDGLVKIGFKYEGIAWKAPATSDLPVYRAYNPNNGGSHIFTTNKGEYDALVAGGWSGEGIAFYSATAGKPVTIYRQYNGNAVNGEHNFTTSSNENATLKALGWAEETNNFAAAQGSTAD